MLQVHDQRLLLHGKRGVSLPIRFLASKCTLHPSTAISILQFGIGWLVRARLTKGRYRRWMIPVALVAAGIGFLMRLHFNSVEYRAHRAFDAFEKRDWSGVYRTFTTNDDARREITESQFVSMMNYLVPSDIKFEFTSERVQSRTDAVGFRQAEAKVTGTTGGTSGYYQYFGMFYDGEQWSPLLCNAVFNGARTRAKSDKELHRLVLEAMEKANVKELKDQANAVKFTVNHLRKKLAEPGNVAYALPYKQAGQ